MKLAAYSTQGKFEGFLELGEDFVFGGNFILLSGIHSSSLEYYRNPDPGLET